MDPSIMWTIVTITACLLVLGLVLMGAWALVAGIVFRRVRRAQREMFEEFDKRHGRWPF